MTRNSRLLTRSSSPLLVVISGPSGVGKDAVLSRLKKTESRMQFIITMSNGPNPPSQPATTTDGVARTTVNITGSGTWEVKVESEPAKQSEILRFEVAPETGLGGTVFPTDTPTPTLPPTSTPTPPLESGEEPDGRSPSGLNMLDWIIAVLVSISLGYGSYRLSALNGQVRWGLRAGLLSLIGGLSAYSYLTLELPGSQALLTSLDRWGLLLITLLGAIIGIIAVWIWRMVKKRP